MSQAIICVYVRTGRVRVHAHSHTLVRIGYWVSGIGYVLGSGDTNFETFVFCFVLPWRCPLDLLPRSVVASLLAFCALVTAVRSLLSTSSLLPSFRELQLGCCDLII